MSRTVGAPKTCSVCFVAVIVLAVFGSVCARCSDLPGLRFLSAHRMESAVSHSTLSTGGCACSGTLLHTPVLHIPTCTPYVYSDENWFDSQRYDGREESFTQARHILNEPNVSVLMLPATLQVGLV